MALVQEASPHPFPINDIDNLGYGLAPDICRLKRNFLRTEIVAFIDFVISF
jgi:hypothetical protein